MLNNLNNQLAGPIRLAQWPQVRKIHVETKDLCTIHVNEVDTYILSAYVQRYVAPVAVV